MRKFFAGIAAMIVEKSPKTGDQTLLYVELAGAALAVTAVVAKKRSAREA